MEAKRFFQLARAGTKTLKVFFGPFVRYAFLGQVKPVLAGYKITHRCNLTCAHCPYWGRSGTELDFQGVLETLHCLRAWGIRILILEGGEPLLWRDPDHTIKDVILAARQLFPVVCVTTNGTVPWGHLPLDRVWVSLDGPPDVHDTIRGKGVFAIALRRVKEEGKGNTFINTTVTCVNLKTIPDLIKMLHGIVAGITIQFYYPYHGLPDPLFVPHESRLPLLAELIRLKQEGYPIANSVGSLNELKREHWSCEDQLLANAEPDGSMFHGCYLKNRASARCSYCGFAAHNEMTLAFQGRVESIITGIRTFFLGNQEKALP